MRVLTRGWVRNLYRTHTGKNNRYCKINLKCNLSTHHKVPLVQLHKIQTPHTPCGRTLLSKTQWHDWKDKPTSTQSTSFDVSVCMESQTCSSTEENLPSENSLSFEDLMFDSNADTNQPLSSPSIKSDANTPNNTNLQTHIAVKDSNTSINAVNSKPKNYIIHTQNVQGFKRAFKIENIIDEMINRDIDVYCVQETWLEGNWEKLINGFLFIHHGVKKCSCKRGNRGVGIFLSPHMQKCYERVENGNRCQSGDNDDDITSGRFLSIKVQLSSTFKLTDGAFRRKRKKQKSIYTFLKICSVYMPRKKPSSPYMPLPPET